MSTVADNSEVPASSISTLPNILSFGVLAVVVCVLVILLLVTGLGTCICCMARRKKVERGGGEESGYWGPEESDTSESSSCTGEILREEEESSVSDMMYRLEVGRPHPGMGTGPPSPSIFSQGDFLMEDISETKRSLVESSPLRDNNSNHVTDMVDDIQDFSYYRTPRSASTVALHSVDLDSPVLSYQGGDTGDLTVEPCGDGGAQEGGWLLYSIMREIQNSSKDKMEDEVFNSSTEQVMINSKLDLRRSIDSSQGRNGVSSEVEVENVMEKKNSSNGIGQVLVNVKDDRTMIEPLEVRVIVKTVGDN